MVQKTEWRVLQECRNAIDTKMHWWLGWVDRLGDAYKIAYDNHKQTIEDWKKQKQLRFEIACSVLSLMTWGGTKWIGMAVETRATALGKAWLKDWAWEPAVEVGKALGGHAGAQLKESAGGASNPVAKAPALFRSQLRTAVNMACGRVKKAIGRAMKVADDRKPLPHQKIQQIEKGYLNTWFMTVSEESVPTQAAVRGHIASKMEALMWALWAPKGLWHKRIESSNPQFPTIPGHFEEAPDIVFDRLKKTLKVRLGFEDKWWRSEATHFQKWAKRYVRAQSSQRNRLFGYRLPKTIQAKWNVK